MKKSLLLFLASASLEAALEAFQSHQNPFLLRAEPRGFASEITPPQHRQVALPTEGSEIRPAKRAISFAGISTSSEAAPSIPPKKSAGYNGYGETHVRVGGSSAITSCQPLGNECVRVTYNLPWCIFSYNAYVGNNQVAQAHPAIEALFRQLANPERSDTSTPDVLKMLADSYQKGEIAQGRLPDGKEFSLDISFRDLQEEAQQQIITQQKVLLAAQAAAIATAAVTAVRQTPVELQGGASSQTPRPSSSARTFEGPDKDVADLLTPCSPAFSDGKVSVGSGTGPLSNFRGRRPSSHAARSRSSVSGQHQQPSRSPSSVGTGSSSLVNFGKMRVNSGGNTPAVGPSSTASVGSGAPHFFPPNFPTPNQESLPRPHPARPQHSPTNSITSSNNDLVSVTEGEEGRRSVVTVVTEKRETTVVLGLIAMSGIAADANKDGK